MNFSPAYKQNEYYAWQREATQFSRSACYALCLAFAAVYGSEAPKSTGDVSLMTRLMEYALPKDGILHEAIQKDGTVRDSDAVLRAFECNATVERDVKLKDLRDRDVVLIHIGPLAGAEHWVVGVMTHAGLQIAFDPWEYSTLTRGLSFGMVQPSELRRVNYGA
jgi:hypothetical protein